jgi:hypothetical protein
MGRANASPSRSTTGLANVIFAIAVPWMTGACLQDLRRVGATARKPGPYRHRPAEATPAAGIGLPARPPPHPSHRNNPPGQEIARGRQVSSEIHAAIIEKTYINLTETF